ncbi:MAG: hypothetical protein WA673_01870 [Candidatus Acidiferrales bacterium]
MPRPNATLLGTDTPNAQRMTRAKMEEFNPFGIVLNNAFLNRTPNYYVYIYNVSDIQHRIERPWAHPAVIIPPCEEGEAYSRPFIIPDIVAEVQPTVGGRVSLAVNGTDGKFLAQDALHPEHPTGDWQTYIKANVANSGSFGTDLYGLGCWWSLNQDPEVDSDEVVVARQRLEGTYEGLIEQATQFSLEGEDGRKKITHMMHRAANYFHLETPWHMKFTRKVSCPGCGQTVSAGLMRHMPKETCGYVFNWVGAIRGGMATRDEAKAAGIELADATVAVQAVAAAVGEKVSARRKR